MDNNKYLFIALAFVAGFWIAKKRTEKKMAATAQTMAEEAVDKATQVFDTMLEKAQNAGATVADVRNVLKAA
jgi:hypothetical protein